MSNTEDRYVINWEQYKQPIVLKCKNWDTIPEHYMFSKELGRIRHILDDFNKVSEYSKKNGQADDCDTEKMFIQKEMSKVIAISGERGSGKTSLLKSLKNILEKEYHVFDIIGPEVLSSDLSIIDIFVSMLRDIVNSLDSECFSTCVLTKLNAQLKSITAAISVDKQKEDYFKNGHSDSSILESLNKRVHLDKLFGEFLEDLLAILQTNNKNPKDFVLIIDDLDLVKNQLIAKLLNDIQRYLDKKIIIIFAYRERQLENSLFEDLITDNQRLLEREVIDNGEVFSQINQFLLKLVPLGNRISLFSKNDLLNKDMKVILKSIDLSLDKELRIFKVNNQSISNEEEKQGLTVEDWFYQFIFIRTDLNIRPIDSRENTKLLLPQSLREIIQVAEIFSEMKPLKKDKGYTKFFQGLIENLSEFKQYIDYKITSQFSANLSMLNFFREWDSAKPYSKNYLTYSHICKNNVTKYSASLYPFNLSNREEYNLTIGDVLAIIEEYKRLPNRLHQHLDYHFCYLIKINYSIYLSLKLFQTFAKRTEIRDIIEKFEVKRKLYLESVKADIKDKSKQEYEESLSALTSQLPELIDYLQVLNSNFMPQEFSFLDYVKGYNLDDYVLTFPTISSFNGNKDYYYKFIQMFINSEWPVLGDISQNIKYGESQFIYRKFYTYTPFFRPQNRKYQINLFTWPTKLEYLVEMLLDLDNLYSPDNEPSDFKDSNGSNKAPSRYIYKNVFHTDIFIRRNYASRDQKTLKDNFTKALRSINDILSGIDQFLDVTPLKIIIYNENEGSFYDKLYEDEKLGDIFNELIDKHEKVDESESEKKLNRKELRQKLKDLLKLSIKKADSYETISKKLDSELKKYKMSIADEKKHSEIINKIKSKYVTMQDIIELDKLIKDIKGEKLETD
ncbi:AAA family ATPase [Streptococcus sanguinis]|uniref:AAA family ATPase n=1 Tax=Streptococcus sanguinis TaxID=1305 RepID=A0ABD4VID4_STRSA|nr:AAA family ATPase [Streptococcus sanguinis]MCY7034398.1 AAA family ATPase [Streptococcus sanguinis]